MKELTKGKDEVNQMVREAEKEKQAEIRLLQKQIEGLKEDKRSLEQRVEEVIERYEAEVDRYKYEHHETVKYFESRPTRY